MARMKRLALVAFLVATLWPSAANAAVPCRNRIYNDWYADGKIASTYPIACYRDALKHVTGDAAVYSSLIDDIKAAEHGALQRERGQTNVPTQIGKGAAAVGKGAVKGVTKKLTGPTSSRTAPNQNVNSTTTLASTPTSGGGIGVPTPILILGALALLLIATGAVGAGVKYRRR
jgi:hypothetical protein